ncbi:hypothetical protein JOQ06_015676, partial [Pogonophryne albipinna]
MSQNASDSVPGSEHFQTSSWIQTPSTLQGQWHRQQCSKIKWQLTERAWRAAVMGGPGGARGQPSTWLTQLAERLPRHTEDPGWLADTHSIIDSRPCPDLWHQCCQDTGLHVGFNQQR